MRQIALFALALIAVGSLAVDSARGDAIPYGTPGIENVITYTFTAAAPGDIVAYFAGSNAQFINELGMSINGGPVGTFGLNNHTSALGQSFVLGHANNAGDVLTFVMHNISQNPGASLGSVYSDPSLNGPYDNVGGSGTGHNHVYSTAYTATSPIIDSIPTGTYVAFEDLPAYWPPDWNYQDETFVFTNIATRESVAPLPGTALCGGALLAGLVFVRRWIRRQPV